MTRARRLTGKAARYGAILAAIGIAASPISSALAGDYLTEGVDSMRTGWIKDEKVLTKANVGKVKLLWTRKFPAEEAVPRDMHNLFNPLVASNVTTPAGKRAIAVVAGVSNMLWGLDAATGQVIWSKKLDQKFMTGVGQQSGTLCPGGQVAMPTLQKMPDGSYKIWALGGDGAIWQIDAATGRDLAPADRFAPPSGKAYALNQVGDYVYTMEAQVCGSATFQMLAYNIKTRRTTVFYPGGGGLWGRRGPMVDTEQRVYSGTGDGPYFPSAKQLGTSFVSAKVDAGGVLQLSSWWAPPNVNYLYRHDLDQNVTPLGFNYKGRKLMFLTSKECRLAMVDRDDVGANHHKAVDRTNVFCNDHGSYEARGVWGGGAAYVNAAGQGWVYMPFWGEKSVTFKPKYSYQPTPVQGGVAAWSIDPVGKGGLKLTPRWVSENMVNGETALVANDIVWTYGDGEWPYQATPDRNWDGPIPKPAAPGSGPSGGRIANSTHATVFALDAQTGKTLWSSGEQITSWNHFSGLTVANGRVYIGTFDGTVWCFGVA